MIVAVKTPLHTVCYTVHLFNIIQKRGQSTLAVFMSFHRYVVLCFEPVGSLLKEHLRA